MNLIQQIEAENIAKLTATKQIPDFRAGDTLRVGVRVVEGERTRVQAFEGVCIARSNKGIGSSFTVRKISFGEGVERVFPLYSPNVDSIDVVRRGGTVSLSGVYAGEADILPMKTMFDRQLNLRMGQCNVKRWIDDLLPLVEDPADPLGVMDLVTHHAPLEDAPALYETFQKKEDGCIKVVLRPGS